jgi:Fic family protein
MMKTFGYLRLPSALYDREIGDLVTLLYEDKGRMHALRHVYPNLLESLQAGAHADSVEASTRIEGIYLERARIDALIRGDGADGGGAPPKSDSEYQVVGYSQALEMIEDGHADLPLSTSSLLRLHETLFCNRTFGSKSRYRSKDYVYTPIDGHMQAVPVSPIMAFETPLVLGSACDSLDEAFSSGNSSPLVLAAVFTVDFLCIRPFDEGNGRVARLFADQLLMKAGFDVARYESVDRIIEGRAAEYYDALNACVTGWERQRNSYGPYVSFWLKAIHEAYGELFKRVESNRSGRLSKKERVRVYIENQGRAVTKREILEKCPDISVSTVENALGEMVRGGIVRKLGAGRATAYEVCAGK